MSYPSDLTDEQWEFIRPYLEYENGYGNRREHPIRHVLNAIFYVNKSGYQWRMLPKEFPPWETVYTYYSRLCKRGKREEILDELNQKSRQKKGRNASPSLVIVDAQSVKTAAHGDRRGYDGGKKMKGRKRTIAVDTQGLLHHVHVSAANENDSVLGCEMVEVIADKNPTVETICTDAGYRGVMEDFTQHVFGILVQIVQKLGKGFQVLPKRWIVERTLAWISQARRLAKDFEVNPNYSENMVRIAMLRLTLKQFTIS